MNNTIKFFEYFEYTFVDNIKPFYGFEFVAGIFKIKSLNKKYAHKKIIFIPMINSFEMSLAQKNAWTFLLKSENILLLNKIISKNSTICVNIPSCLESQIDSFVKTYPSTVASVNVKDIINDEYKNNNNKLYIWEAINPVRLFLHYFYQNQKLEFIDGFDADYKYNYKNLLMSELILENGILAWLDVAFNLAIKENIKTDVDVYKVYETINKNDDVVILAGIYDLITIAKNIESYFEIDSTNVVDFNKNKKILNQYKLCKLDSKNISDLVKIPGFIVYEFITNENLLNWQQLYSKGMYKAFENVKKNYEEWTKIEVNASYENILFKFAHRLTAQDKEMLPNSFNLLLAAQGVIDHNFAVELAKECQNYPTNAYVNSVLIEIFISINELFSHTIKFSISKFETIQRHRKSLKSHIRVAKDEKHKNIINYGNEVNENEFTDSSWINGPKICSFPEEDIFMEDYALLCREQAREMVKQKEIVITELQSTFGEGLDIRSTVREWHNEKIMIREEANIGKADIGAVIFLFCKAKDYNNYKWKTYWNAERHDKTDLMFFATDYENNIIGPGVAKSEFGGFAAIPVPNYGFNTWYDGWVSKVAENPLDFLVLTSAIATNHRVILIVGDEKPSINVMKILKNSGKSIVYMMLNEIAPDKIRRLKTFHILAEAGVRKYADKYIKKY